MKGNEAEILLRDMQEYRELTDRVKAIYGDQMTLKDMVDVMERIIREPGRKDPVNARILTYDEASMWDEYRKIGTVEECREAMEKQRRKTVKKSIWNKLYLESWLLPCMWLRSYSKMGLLPVLRAEVELEDT